jgi:hypothetical protein
MIIEEWKDILGYEDYYEISNLGIVRTKNRIVVREGYKDYIINSRVIQLGNHSKGYNTAALTNSDGKRTTFYVHRLVGLHFIPNEHNYTDINHIDGNKKNNSVDNLEWCSRSHNILHAYNVLNNSGKRSIKYKLKIKQHE